MAAKRRLKLYSGPGQRSKPRFLIWLLWPLLGLVALLLIFVILNLKSVYAVTGEVAVTIAFLILVVAGPPLVIWFLVNVIISLGTLRRKVGWYTKSEKNNDAVYLAYLEGLTHAAWLRQHMAAGNLAPTQGTWDVVLEPGEHVALDTSMQYGRWYSSSVAFSSSAVVVGGHPVVATGVMVGSLIASAINQSRARAAAQLTWRDNQMCRTLVTDRRILCYTGQGWLSFSYSAVLACYPDPAGSTLVLQFENSEPLRLHGYHGASLCVIVIAAIYGTQALVEHPSLVGLPPAT